MGARPAILSAMRGRPGSAGGQRGGAEGAAVRSEDRGEARRWVWLYLASILETKSLRCKAGATMAACPTGCRSQWHLPGESNRIPPSMKYLAKFVAGMLAIAMCAMPLQAAASCLASAHHAMHCSHCCTGMAEEDKTTQAMQAMDMGLARSAEPSQVPCCAVSTGESVPPAMLQRVCRPISLTVLVVDAAAYTPAHLVTPSTNIQVLPNRWTNGRAQSILCTFLI